MAYKKKNYEAAVNDYINASGSITNIAKARYYGVCNLTLCKKIFCYNNLEKY